MYLIDFITLFSWLFAQCLFVAASPHIEKQIKANSSSAQASISQIKQSPIQTIPPPRRASPKKDDEVLRTEAIEAQRRAFAVSIIMSLADDARSYKDLALRARVLARSADALWDADPDGARVLIRRAWEAAEKADAAEDVSPSKSAAPVVVIALRRPGEGDSRAEVLPIAARRDRTLGEEFL